MKEQSNKHEVLDKIEDLLEERQRERRRRTKAPTYLNPALDRRKGDRRTRNQASQ